MDNNLLQQYKSQLEKERQRLEKSLSGQELVTDMGSDTEGKIREEEADEAEAMSSNIGLQQNLKWEISEVDSALLRIEDGIYGLCEECNEPIEDQVLKTNPAHRYCKAHNR